MRVGVTGSHGFIGSAVRRQLDLARYECVGFDFPNDVTHRGDVYRFVEQCDAVINLAGILGTAETIGRDRELVEVNVLGALNVADACAVQGIPLVQIGTGHKGQPNVYAITKACAEDLLLARAQWRGEKVTVVRAYHAYGPGQKAPAPWGSATVTKIIPNFVCHALAGLPIPIHGDGRQVVDLIHVDDVARTLVMAIDGPFGEVVEAGTGVGRTVFDVARSVADACESRGGLILVPTPDGFTPGVSVVASKPAPWSTGWQMGLLDTIPYYRALFEGVAA